MLRVSCTQIQYSMHIVATERQSQRIRPCHSGPHRYASFGRAAQSIGHPARQVAFSCTKTRQVHRHSKGFVAVQLPQTCAHVRLSTSLLDALPFLYASPLPSCAELAPGIMGRPCLEKKCTLGVRNYTHTHTRSLVLSSPCIDDTHRGGLVLDHVMQCCSGEGATRAQVQLNKAHPFPPNKGTVRAGKCGKMDD